MPVTRKEFVRLRIALAGASLMAISAAHAADAPSADELNSAGFSDEITVTARRRAENVQDVPLSISVLNGEELGEAGIQTLRALQFEVPDTAAFLSNPRQATVAIRGIGANSAIDGAPTPVGIYVDGVFYDRISMLSYDLIDLAQVEVLRGPQGTLFGKNNTAGALNLTTNRPNFTPSGSVETSLGEHETRDFKVIVNQPVIDNVLALRLAAYSDQHDGYLHSISDRQYNDLNQQGVRTQLLYTPDAKLEVLWRADLNVEHDHAGASLLFNTGAASGGPRYVPYSAWSAKLPQVIDSAHWLTDASNPQRLLTNNGGTSLEVNYKFDNDYTLTSITAFRSWLFRPHNQSTIAVPDNTNNYYNYSSQSIGKDLEVTQELRLASPTDVKIDHVPGNFDFVTGTFTLWRRMNTTSQAWYPSNYAFWTEGKTNAQLAALPLAKQAADNYYALENSETMQSADAYTVSPAAFFQANWHVDDHFTLTSGVRETYESSWEGDRNYGIVSGGGNVSNAALQTYNPGLYYKQLAPYAYTNSLANWNTAELVSLSYRPASGQNYYVSWNHSSTAGGFNDPQQLNYVAASPTLRQDAATATFGPETNYTEEIGAKWTLPQYHATIDFDLFYSQVYNYQASVSYTQPNSTITYNGTYNIPELKSRGAELQASIRPLTGLKLTQNVAYDLVYYGPFKQAPPTQGQAGNGLTTQDLSGARVWGTPRWNLNTSIGYTAPVADNVDGYFRGEYTYKSGFYGYYSDDSYSLLAAVRKRVIPATRA